MTVRVGMLGLSEGNGHPFSFSAIINGYDDDAFAAAGWDGIHAYLRQQDPADFGVPPLEVTHAWTQTPALTAHLCRACRIPNPCERPEQMLGAVDAVILARDDFTRHVEMARPFLEAGLPMFIDKPLGLRPQDLAYFRPFLNAGRLMSVSGMRYARELDTPRATLADYGTVQLIRGTIVKDWQRYGIHVIDAVLNLVPARPVAAVPLRSGHQSVAVEMDDGSLLQLDALGEVARCFRIELIGTQHSSSHEITDNFGMFRRLLHRFAKSLEDRKPAVPVQDTLVAMRLLMAGSTALETRRRVVLHDIDLQAAV